MVQPKRVTDGDDALPDEQVHVEAILDISGNARHAVVDSVKIWFLLKVCT
jgi:hypothetical protein